MKMWEASASPSFFVLYIILLGKRSLMTMTELEFQKELNDIRIARAKIIIKYSSHRRLLLAIEIFEMFKALGVDAIRYDFKVFLEENEVILKILDEILPEAVKEIRDRYNVDELQKSPDWRIKLIESIDQSWKVFNGWIANRKMEFDSHSARAVEFIKRTRENDAAKAASA